ncbi:DamX protein [Candidatus Pantoea symbiotica]|jgi:DamX protein|uniref:Cell division protein DamX n=1 Tax=Candidatus Pantoea symbiotica TaxID=1884370 RepID=A0A1I4DUT1_9GAMM|nr:MULTISPECIES: SPOR domain-containing protein [Pantoea]KAJ9431501.1 SPOR domain-containing protein [Pantoea sp. YR343]SFK97458.1 DamX protein [Pantoea symbiotica]SFV06665.1 DamX protein [Pantoea sp. YR525]
MDEFKPEDELKPDASDRRPTRPRKSSSAPKVKVPVSRQHMMMGIGILVLLLVVLGIGSALTGPDEKKPATNTANNGAAPSAGGSEKNIDLSGSTSMSGQQNATPSADGSAPQNTAGSDGQSISMPSVSSTPTQAAPVDTPANQQRVTLPGDLNTALNNQQGSVDAAAQGAQGNSSLPTAPATVSGNGKAITPPAMRSETPARTSNNGTRETHASTPHKTPAATKPAPVKENNTRTTATRNSAPASTSGASKSLPSGGNYTLQLSGASKEESLNAWARKQNLSGYHVYKTTRNGEPWYVLVSGAYATPADAKRAVASLPAEVRAANPWVKPLSQVKKESQ